MANWNTGEMLVIVLMCFFYVFPINDVNVIARFEWSLPPNSQGLRDDTTNSKYPSRLQEMRTVVFPTQNDV